MYVVKQVFRIILYLLIPVFLFVIWYSWNAFPAISGFVAKNVCSAVFLQHRTPQSVSDEELSSFPLSLGSYKLDLNDSSVTASVWGMGRRKAFFRNGLGATLINDYREQQIRKEPVYRPAPPHFNMSVIPWPQGDLITQDSSLKIDFAKLYSAIDTAFHETKWGKPSLTRAVVVVYNGNIIAERYAPGFNKETLFPGWSMTKSVMSSLTGILVENHKLNEFAPVPLPQWKNTIKQDITLKDLLQQSSGIGFIESYLLPGDATKMLFSKGDMAGYTASLRLRDRPGTSFYYSSGNTNIISLIIRQTLGDSAYYAFPYDSLFYRIHAFSPIIEPDASGTLVGSSYIWATARDYARFGLLYLNNGNWMGTQIISKQWIDKTRQPAPTDPQKHYGYQFWLNGLAKNLKDQSFPGVPSDMYYADGFGGQGIYIIPSKKLVVVRLGVLNINDRRFLRKVVESVSH